jgi:hypothetical protein
MSRKPRQTWALAMVSPCISRLIMFDDELYREPSGNCFDEQLDAMLAENRRGPSSIAGSQGHE